MENWRLQSRHFHNRRVARNTALDEAQLGQTALPSGQRIETMKCNALSASAKYLIASNRVLGNSVLSFMPKQSHKTVGESSILLPKLGFDGVSPHLEGPGSWPDALPIF